MDAAHRDPLAHSMNLTLALLEQLADVELWRGEGAGGGLRDGVSLPEASPEEQQRGRDQPNSRLLGWLATLPGVSQPSVLRMAGTPRSQPSIQSCPMAEI